MLTTKWSEEYEGDVCIDKYGNEVAVISFDIVKRIYRCKSLVEDLGHMNQEFNCLSSAEWYAYIIRLEMTAIGM